MFDKKQDKTYNKHKETIGCGKLVLLKDLYSERNRLMICTPNTGHPVLGVF